jgi:hypothetical protein
MHATKPSRFRGTFVVLATAGALVASLTSATVAFAATGDTTTPAAVATPTGGTTVTVTPTGTTTDTAPAAAAAATDTPLASTSAPTGKTDSGATAAIKPKVCATAPRAPWRLDAVRDTADPTTVKISWAAVECAVHYNVSVFSKGSDTVDVVDGGSASSFTVSGIDPGLTYRIQVSSRDAKGEGGTTPVFYLRPIVPMGVSGMKAVYSDVSSAILRWKAPADRMPSLYHLKVVRLKDKTVLEDRDIDGGLTEMALANMDARGMYVVTLQALNKLGRGPLSRLVLGDERPNQVRSVGAIRDPGDPAKVIVSWLPSDNTLRGNVIGYEIGYGASTASDRLLVKDTDATVTIPYEKSGVITVRVVTDTGKSAWSKALRVLSESNPDLSTTNPSIDLVEQSGTISIAAAQQVADNYRLMVKILPTANNGNFADTQYAQAGSNLLTFRKVPDGSYLVTVLGADKELARKYINVGNVGGMFAPDWMVTRGKANLLDQTIDMYYGSETRVISTRPFASQDMVLATAANLKSGDGYGIWFRASGFENDKPSGLTFQYDPKWGNNFIVRLWNNGSECSNPIATTKFPASLKVYGSHDIVVAAQGDTLFATIDGVRLFDLPSLSKAIASNSCKYVAPTGTQVGFRTWGAGTAAVFTGTTMR